MGLPEARGLGPRMSMLATYPPTACGIATFAAALTDGLESHGSRVAVVRVADDLDASDRRVVAELAAGSARSRREAAAVLNDAEAAIIQHEYGIFGGTDGDEVLDVLEQLDSPPIVVAHTVPREPTEHQHRVLEEVAAHAGTLVVMSGWAQSTLLDRFDVDADKVVVVPHGARHRAAPAGAGRRAGAARGAAPLLVTWGLLGPGKGIEWVLEALDELNGHGVSPRYLIAGRTHPKVLAREGERYREMLERRVAELGLEHQVRFDRSYRTMDELDELIERAAMVILPYDSEDQVTSGVLVDAVAGGCPVVATAFPHAVELLESGAGAVVPRRSPPALAATLRGLLSDRDALDRMAAEASRIAPTLSWTAVAARYLAMSHVRRVHSVSR